MKHLLVLLLLLPLSSKAQVNYVLNPSFEQYSQCPYDLDQVAFANYWNSIDTSWHWGEALFREPRCLPEYCNACSSHLEASVPANEYFYQYPRSGNGMVQTFMIANPATWVGSTTIHDYLQGRINGPLQAGKSYCVTFYVNLEEFSGYAINNIGAYLDDGSIDVGQDSVGCTQAQTAFTPQVEGNAKMS